MLHLLTLPALLAAFKILGYTPFHASMMEFIPHLHNLYTQALQAKYEGTFEPYGRREFDKLFMGRWDVSVNMPGSLLADELIAAYPNAKIILTHRDVDKWQHSMKVSVDAAAKWKSFAWLSLWDPNGIGLWWNYHQYQHSLRPILAPREERQAFIDHYRHINEIVPPERLLNYNVAEGWEPLCKFLGQAIPAEAFPNVNNKNSFLAGRRRRLYRMLRVIAMRTMIPTAILGAVSYWSWRNNFDFRAIWPFH